MKHLIRSIAQILWGMMGGGLSVLILLILDEATRNPDIKLDSTIAHIHHQDGPTGQSFLVVSGLQLLSTEHGYSVIELEEMASQINLDHWKKLLGERSVEHRGGLY